MLVDMDKFTERPPAMWLQVARQVAHAVEPEAMPRWMETEDVVQEVLIALWERRKWVGLNEPRALAEAHKAVGRLMNRQRDILDFETALLPEHELLEAA